MKSSHVLPPFARTWLAGCLLATTAASLVPPSVAWAQPVDAKSQAEARKFLAQAEAFERGRDWEKALDHFSRSNAAATSARALLGIANCQYQLRLIAEAYDSYENLIRAYGASLTRPQRTEADSRMAELRQKTGLVDLRVVERDASVYLDEKLFGKAPMSGPIRLPVGAHKLRVTKDGFGPYEALFEIKSNETTSVNVSLVSVSDKARLVVTERSGQPVRVLVDGVDVGAAPWEGDVAPGHRIVSVRSATAGAPSQEIDLVRGEQRKLEFVATSSRGRLTIRTADGKGIIYLDGKIVGEGTYESELPIGRYQITVKREGYLPREASVEIQDKDNQILPVTLMRPDVGATGDAIEGERLFQGVYGGFGLMAGFGTGAMGTELDTRCGALGATSCSTPKPFGGGLMGYVGYTFYPIGFELFAAGMVDVNVQRAHYSGTVQTGQNPVSATPARDEKYTFLRAGGLAALRARWSMQTTHVRFSIALGPGFSYRQVALKRDAETPDGFTNLHVGTAGYFSPALSGDVAVHWRAGRALAISLGAFLWVDNAGSETVAGRSDDGYLVNRTTNETKAIATPNLTLAHGAQVFLGPYIGMQFGP